MSQSVELPITYEGVDKAIAEIKKVDKSLQDLAKAYKGDIVADQIGKLATHFEGFTAQAIKGVESLAKGFLAGGPLGLAIAGAGVAVGALADHFKAQEEAAKKAREAREAVLAQEKQALDNVLGKLNEAKFILDALDTVEWRGLDPSEARRLAERNMQLERMTKLQAELAEARRVEGETAARWEKATALARRASHIQAFQDRRDALAAELNQSKERVERLVAQERQIAAERENTQKQAEISSRTREIESARADKEARAKSAEEARKARREDALRQGEELAKLFYEDEKRKLEEARRLEQEAEEDRLKDALRITETRAKIIADAEKKRLDAAAKAADEAQKEEERRAKETAQAVKRAEEEKLDAARQAAYERQRFNEQLFVAGESLARQAFDAITGEQEVTKAELEEKAKRAALEAAFQTAVGFANLAASRPDAATSAFISAAQFAAIAGGNAVASATASDAPAAARESGGGSTRSTSSGASRSSIGAGDGGPQVTVVLPSGELYPTKGEMYRALREANHQVARRR